MCPNDLTHDEIRVWLERALHGHELLPRLTPDEASHLGILRLEKTMKPAARDSLRDGCRRLVRRFCRDGREDAAYAKQLLLLAAAFKDPETVSVLAELPRRFPQLTDLTIDVRLAVLATLVDTPPPQSPEFWELVLRQSPVDYASMALSGVLATHPTRAVEMLPYMPDRERSGKAAALKLDLAWDDLPPSQRFGFVQNVRGILPNCGACFAAPVRRWTDSKMESHVSLVNPGLHAALTSVLGEDSKARAWNSRLMPLWLRDPCPKTSPRRLLSRSTRSRVASVAAWP
jgi:hypothetical protein